MHQERVLPEIHVIGLSLQDDTTLPQLIAKIAGSEEVEETFLEGQ
jgi:hypothetical protein